MRRALVLLLALGSIACSRDLALPDASPPRVDEIQLVGLEGTPPPSPLPVLGGELVAIRGGGFRSDVTQLEVLVGGEDAEVLSAAEDRVVVRVPALASRGVVDVQARTSVGFRAAEGALRYDGPGQPEGFDTSDLQTAVPIGFVAPVQPPGSTGFHDLAIAIGASDSALVVVPEIGLAATTIPLGLVPTSAAARIVPKPDGSVGVQVLALARGGEVALGETILRDGLVASRVAARPLATSVTPQDCTSPQVLFTNLGAPVAAWIADATGQQRIAAIDESRLTLGEYAPAATPHGVPAPIVGWAPWKAHRVIFAAGGELYLYDASDPATAPAPLTVLPGGTGLPTRVSSLLAPCAGAALFFHTLAAVSSPSPAATGTDLLALSFRGGGVDWVALVDLTPGPAEGTVRAGLAGTIATSLALAPEPPYEPTSWAVLAAGISNLYRFRPLDGAPACRDLVPDAALELSTEPGVLPTIGGMLMASGGTRLLATTPENDIVTVLPPSLTSAGPVYRFASYGGVSMQVASLGGEALPVAVAEHAYSVDGLSALDTGSALLVVSLAAENAAGAVALGGSGYGRGAVWLDPPAGGALAYTGDLPSITSSDASIRGGAAAVTGFAAGTCPGEDVRITGSRPVAGGPDLVAQGPARAGAFGPDGIARWGPPVAPVYAAKETTLAVYAPSAANLACLAGSTLDWTSCPADATIPLGVEPLDVTLSAGDTAVAIRRLDTGACSPTLGLPSACTESDLLCLRASCPPAKELRIARPGVATPVTVPLPARPAAVAADRGGGFLVTLPCALSSVGGGDDCFPSSTVCDGFRTGPGGADGALLHVSEDGAAVGCLAVLPALAGPIAVTPNGAEAWVTGTAFGAQILSRLELPRRTTDGALDASTPRPRIAVEALGTAAKTLGAFPAGGVAFTPDGATAIVTMPGEYRILLYR
jgi:hypothetical protein